MFCPSLISAAGRLAISFKEIFLINTKQKHLMPILITPTVSPLLTESQNVRGWKGPLWVTQSNPLPKQGHPGQLHSTASRRVWNLSREGDSTASLGSLGQGSVTLRGRSSSSHSAGASSASVCARCPLSCRWAPLKRVWPRPPDTHPTDIYKHL